MIEIDSELFSALSDHRGLDAWVAEREAEFAAEMSAVAVRIATDAVRRYATTLTAAGDEAAFNGMQAAWEAWAVEVGGENVAGMYIMGNVSAWVQAPGGAGTLLEHAALDSWIEVVNVNALDYQRLATNRIVGAGTETWEHVRAATVDSLGSGSGAETLTEQIQAMTDYSEYRSNTIARTETVGAFNGG